jgi:hypothetical protein
MKMCRGSQTWLKLSKIIGHVTWRPNYVLLLPAPWNRHTGALFGWNGIRLLARPSFCPRVSARLLLEEFPWNFMLGTTWKSVEKVQIWFTSDKKYRTLYVSLRAKLYQAVRITGAVKILGECTTNLRYAYIAYFVSAAEAFRGFCCVHFMSVCYMKICLAYLIGLILFQMDAFEYQFELLLCVVTLSDACFIHITWILLPWLSCESNLYFDWLVGSHRS